MGASPPRLSCLILPMTTRRTRASEAKRIQALHNNAEFQRPGTTLGENLQQDRAADSIVGTCGPPAGGNTASRAPQGATTRRRHVGKQLQWADGQTDGAPADAAVRVVTCDELALDSARQGVLEFIRYDQTEYGLALDAGERELRAHEVARRRAKLRHEADNVTRLQRLQSGGSKRAKHILCKPAAVRDQAETLAEEVRSLWAEFSSQLDSFVGE